MGYTTTNELAHFDFEEAYVCDVQIIGEIFHLLLDNVKILPENSCNRDIRLMRTNQLLLKFLDCKINSLVREGYKVYDANGNLKEELADEEIPEAQWGETIKHLLDGIVYDIHHKGQEYELLIDAMDERSYLLTITATMDEEHWERFINV